MLEIEAHEYLLFLRERRVKYPQQRLGQAFYNHFNLHKVNNKDKKKFEDLYTLKDEDKVREIINKCFSFR